MNRSSSTAHLQRRLTAILLITIAGIVIILTFTSQLEKKNNLLHNNHDDRRTRRRRLQGVMGDQGGGLLHHLDPKTVELKGQGTYSKNMVYIPPDNNGNGELTLRHPLLQLQQQQVQQIQQPPISPGFNNFNQQQQLQFQPQPLQQQQPVQQFAQPQIQQQEPINNNINTIVNTNNNNLPNPNNNVASNLIQVAPQNPQETAAAAAILPSATSNNNFPPSSPPLTIKPYNINNTLQALKAFRYQGFFFVYDSSANEFVIVHATPTCDLGCVRIYRIASIIAFALRKNFPERFPSLEDNDGTNGVNTGSTTGDLVFAISTGDVPRIHSYCLSPDTNYCSSPDFGPILQFGSVFVNTEYMPTMIAMPQPVRPHMPCFDEWQLLGQVCTGLQPAQVAPANDPSGVDGGEEFTGLQSFASGLVFGQELGLIAKPDYWNELIPQIIWRGTDFVFLHTMFPKMRRPDYQRDIYPKEWTRKGGENKRWAIDALWEMGEQLQPRWRGVLLTSEAELEAEEFREAGDATLPWLNIKFASCNFNRKKVDAGENPDFVKLQSVGIKAIGERVNMQEQAKYRYHIDLGGGGGTSWTGTIEKLALPGVLFHHVTPTKDWFYDRLQPWVHYIPVNSDLTDLREKFEWAESHPVEAQKIAEAGTEFARWIGTPEGFGELYQQNLVAPLKGIIDAYQPSPDASDAGKSVLDIIKEKGSPEYTIVSRCSGNEKYSCRDLNGKIPNGN